MDAVELEDVLSGVQGGRKHKLNGGKYLQDAVKPSPSESLKVKQTEETVDISSKLSDISDSSSEQEEEPISTDFDYRQFEKDLKYRHAEACKAMSVSIGGGKNGTGQCKQFTHNCVS